MNRCPTAAIPLALAGLLVATVSNAADTTPHYDDARVTGVSVISQNPADQAGPMAFYEKSQLKAVCQYGYVQTGSGAGIPWTKVHLYILSSAGVPFVFSTQKACLSQTCTAEGGVPTDVGTGAIGIGTGAVGIGCKITRQDGVELKDADPANNKKEVFITVKPRPLNLGSARSSPVASKPVLGVVPGLAGSVKQCPTSLSAAVKVDAHQLNSPLHSPADMAQSTVMLYFKNSQAAGNNVVCRYSTHNKDVPDLVVTIKCPNASAQSGKPGAFNCTN